MTQTYHKTFTSPINEDNGREHRFIGHATNTMWLSLSYDLKSGGPDSGAIHWKYTMLDGPHKGKSESRRIDLWFDPQFYQRRDKYVRLTAFDGVFELPEEAIELLESNGFDATMAKL